MFHFFQTDKKNSQFVFNPSPPPYTHTNSQIKIKKKKKIKIKKNPAFQTFAVLIRHSQHYAS